MKKSELKQLIREEIQKLNEGHSFWIIDLEVKNQTEAKKKVEELISADKKYGDDLQHFIGSKFVGTTSEERLEKLATKYEDDYVIVGIVDGKYMAAAEFRD